MATGLLGQEQLDEMMRLGLTASQLESLVRWAMSVYRGGSDEPEEGDQGNAKAPRRRGRTGS